MFLVGLGGWNEGLLVPSSTVLAPVTLECWARASVDDEHGVGMMCQGQACSLETISTIQMFFHLARWYCVAAREESNLW